MTKKRRDAIYSKTLPVLSYVTEASLGAIWLDIHLKQKERDHRSVLKRYGHQSWTKYIFSWSAKSEKLPGSYNNVKELVFFLHSYSYLWKGLCSCHCINEVGMCLL